MECLYKSINKKKKGNAILSGKAQIAKAVNATLISLNEAPQGYKEFDGGVSKKFVIDPHGLVRA